MNSNLRSLLLFFVILFPSFAYGDAVWISRQFKPSDGLAYQVVRDIVQTPDNTILFATWGGGLSRFDGSQWETLNEGKDLSDFMIRILAYDNQGGLWIGTEEGIRYFDGQQWKLFTKKTTPALLNDSVYSILPRKNGEIWFGMRNGYLYSYDPKKMDSERWQMIRNPAFFHNDGIRGFLEMEDGSIWVAGKGLFHWTGEVWNSSSSNDFFYSLCKTKDGRIFAAGTESVFQWNGEKWEIIEEAGKNPRSLVEAQDGTLFLGTTLGVRVFQDGIWKDFQLAKDIPFPSVETIRVMKDGSIWIGTRNGVYLVRRSDWSVFTPPFARQSTSGERFFSSSAISPHGISATGEISRVRNDEWVRFGTIHETDNDVVKILSFNEERFLVHRKKAIVEYNTHDLAVIRSIPITLPPNFSNVDLTSDGTFWLHGYGGDGVYYWTGTEWKLYERKNKQKTNRIQLVKETRDGTRWFVFSDAIEPAGKEYPWLEFYNSPSFRGHRITDICVARNGFIWFGSSGSGIFVFNGKEVQRYTTRNGLPNDWILCLYEHSDGTLWAGMENSTVASFRDGRWIAFTQEEMQLGGYVTNISEDPNGDLWFAVEPNGLVRYHPSATPPETVIDVYPKVVVPQGMGIFSFHGWDAWHQTLPKELVFSWRIFRQRDDREIVPWTPFKSAMTIHSPPLDPGNYIFEVRTADKERNVDPTPAVARFTVESFFYMKPGFLIPIALFMILASISLGIVYKKHLELRESERRLSQAQQIAHIGHWIADFSRNKLFLSDETYRILGTTPKDFRGSYKSYLRLVHPKDLPAVLKGIREALRDNQPITIDHRIIRSDGLTRTVHIQAEIAVKDSGRPFRIMGAIQDITDKKRFEEETQRMHTLEAIGVLAGGIAHDFNNLLTIILGNIALAKSLINPQEKIHQRLSESEKASQRAYELTQQLITFSKGNISIRKISSLPGIVRDSVLSTMEGTLARCEFRIPNNLRLVDIDQGQFNQVIRNLVVNAVQAMPEGGLIQVSMENVTIEEIAGVFLAKGDYVKITIRDEGCGIPPVDMPKVFDPYFTTKNNVTQKGLGLGLAICFSIIKQHKGYINIESELGVGTKVHIYLPASTEKFLD